MINYIQKEAIDMVSARLEYFLIGNLKYQSSQEEFIKLLDILKGVEYVIALFETREPNYISGKNIEFTNNRTQQKYRLSGTCDIICVSKFEEADDNLQEYKRIIGVLDEKK